MLDELTASHSHRKPKPILKYLLILLLTLLLCLTGKHFNVQEVLKTLLTSIEHLGHWGPITFIIVYNLATLLFIPGSILTLGGGLIFGIVWGSIYVCIAAVLGATLAFLIGRYLSRNWVVKQLEEHPKFKAIDEAVAQEGFKIVFLTRLSPLFPFNLLNYAFGITQVSLKDYCLGSLGMIPGTIMYVYMGSLGSELATLGMECQWTTPQATTLRWSINILGLLATIGVTLYATRIAQKTLATRV